MGETTISEKGDVHAVATGPLSICLLVDKTFVVFCKENYRQGRLIWLKGDTYTLNSKQMTDRLVEDLAGFLANFQPQNETACELFEAIDAAYFWM